MTPARARCCCALALGRRRPARRRRTIRLPDGPWAPDPLAAEAFEAASAGCRGVRTLTAEIAVRGQAGPAQGPRPRPRRIRARRRAAPRGAGAVRRADLHPRRRAPTAPRCGCRATAGCCATRRSRTCSTRSRACPDRATTCSRSSPGASPRTSRRPAPGQRGPGGWMMVDLAGGIRAFLARDGAGWRIAAGHRDAGAGAAAWSVSYAGFSSGFPGAITIRQEPAGGTRAGATALTLQVSQLETNVPIDARAFDVVDPRRRAAADAGRTAAVGAACRPREQRRDRRRSHDPHPCPRQDQSDAARRRPCRPTASTRSRRCSSRSALHDTLEVTSRRGPFELTCSDPAVPVDDRNLVTRAARALWSALGRAGRAARRRHPPRPSTSRCRRALAAAVPTRPPRSRPLPRLWRRRGSRGRSGRHRVRGSAPTCRTSSSAGPRSACRAGRTCTRSRTCRAGHVVLALPGFGVATADAYRWFDDGPARRRPARGRVPAAAIAGVARAPAGAGQRPRRRR